MEEQNEKTQEKLGINVSGAKATLISELMMKGENALIEQDDSLLRFRCWKSISILIDNRLTTPQKKKLKELEKVIQEKSYTKNKYVNQQWEKGSNSWYENRFILNKTKMLFYSNNYIKYVNLLLKQIGMDITSKDDSEGDVD